MNLIVPILLLVGGAYTASCVEHFAGQEAAKAAFTAMVVMGVVIDYAGYQIARAIKEKKP